MTGVFFVVASVGVGLVGAVAPSATASALARPTSSGCHGPVDIVGFRFSPSAVAPGATSTAHLSARNCLDHAEDAVLTMFGRFTGSDTSGCPVIDPLARRVDFTARGSDRSEVGYLVPAQCTAARLQLTAEFSDTTGTVLTRGTAVLSITSS